MTNIPNELKVAVFPFLSSNPPKESNIEYFFWESELIGAIDKNLLSRSISQLGHSRTDLSFISSDDIRHVHRQWLRERYPYSLSEYIFESCCTFLLSHYRFLLEKYKIQRAVFLKTPHHFGDHLLVAICRALDIRSLRVDINAYLHAPSPTSTCVNIYDINSDEFLPGPSDYKCELSLNDFIRRIQIDTDSNKRYIYNDSYSEISRTSSHNKKQMMDACARPEESEYFKGLEYRASIKSLYNEFCSKYPTKYDKEFIVICLGAEPEASLSPQGLGFLEQLYFVTDIARLASTLGLGFAVKEHPAMLNLDYGDLAANSHHSRDHLCPRTSHFYTEISNLESFMGFIPNSISIKQLIENQRLIAVASIGGSVLLQALFAKKLVVQGTKTWLGESTQIYNLNGSPGASLENELYRWKESLNVKSSTFDFLISNLHIIGAVSVPSQTAKSSLKLPCAYSTLEYLNNF